MPVAASPQQPPDPPLNPGFRTLLGCNWILVPSKSTIPPSSWCAQGFVFINSDPAMVDDQGQYAKARNTNLNEDLGKVRPCAEPGLGSRTQPRNFRV